MKVLVVGGGAREHALAWRLSRSPSVSEVWTAPGNPGTAALGPRGADAPADVDGLAAWIAGRDFDLTVVGPEWPLVEGLADRLAAQGSACFGPLAAAARLEGSKAFAKTLMASAGVPTAPFRVVADVEEAMAAVRELGLPIVLKADGLAAGKGVVVAHSHEEARRFAWDALVSGRFGEAGRRLVVEAFLDGEEVSMFYLTDGERAHALPPARDYKRLATGDTGPNTGGMGAYAPADVPAGFEDQVRARVIEPVLAALRRAGTPYRGLLYAGLMRTVSGPHVLEFNCRFGDPETQAVLPILGGDFAETLRQCAAGRLEEAPRATGEACVALVLAAPGYPDHPVPGGLVHGVERAAGVPGVRVFQAGTRASERGLLVAGGRVLTVSATGATREEARERAYRGLAALELEGGQWRADVAGLPVLSTRKESA